MSNRIEELVIEGAGQQFRGRDLRSLQGPGVYVLLKAEQPIYVGVAKNLLSRISIARADHPGRYKAFEECSKVLLYPCKSHLDAIQLEKLLIEGLTPKHNSRVKHGEALRVLGISRASGYVAQ